MEKANYGLSELKTVKVKNMEGLREWCKNLTYAQAQETQKKIVHLAKANYADQHQNISRACSKLYNMYGSWYSGEENEKWGKELPKKIQYIEEFFDYAEHYNQKISAAVWDKAFAFLFIGNPQEGIIIPDPEQYFDCVEEESLLDVSPAELKMRLTESNLDANVNLVSTDGSMTTTHRQAKERLESQLSDIENLEKEMEKVKKAQTGELAVIMAQIEEMQAKLEEKKEAMLAELNRKMDEMEAQREVLEDQIYMLDSQIFAIRCYAGETVKFTQLKQGTPAATEEPVVIHQKLRFLDEELGKLTALYTIRWADIGMFEEFLRHNPVALETFAPNNKCVVLVRLSRTGTIMERGQEAYSNILDKYRYYHGKTVGIIVRNGENLYLGWTDEDYVKIDDDLVGNVVDVTPVPEPEHMYFEHEVKAYKKQVREKKKKAMTDILSRVFVSNILQGIIDNSSMLPLPKGVRVDQDTPYIRYALADAWLDDNRFGSFSELIERCNQTVTTGDIVLTVQRLVPEHDRSWGGNSWANANRPWENSRGRGEANRTHDCSVSDCTLYPINLVEYDDPIKMVRYRFKVPSFIIGNDEEEWRYGETQECFWNEPEERENREFVLSYEKRERHVYVSVEKEENWRRYGMPYEKTPRANFELYTNEYINLTYMNSVWLGWAITQKKLGDWRISGQTVDYNYGIRYLNTALDYIRKREAEEKELLDAIDASICKNPDWPVQLSEWKLAHGVRTITPYQAKRFAKAIQQ